MFFIYSLLFILLFSLVVLTFFYVFLVVGYVKTGVPFVPRPKNKQNKIFELINLKPGETLVDLGCGDATFLIAAEKKYKIKAIGYEKSLCAFLISKINVFLSRSKAKIFYQNFFEADLSEADVVFCYLFPFLMVRVSEKLKKDLKPRARIYSLAFSLSDWPNQEVRYLDEKKKKGKIFVYYQSDTKNTNTLE